MTPDDRHASRNGAFELLSAVLRASVRQVRGYPRVERPPDGGGHPWQGWALSASGLLC